MFGFKLQPEIKFVKCDYTGTRNILRPVINRTVWALEISIKGTKRIQHSKMSLTDGIGQRGPSR